MQHPDLTPEEQALYDVAVNFNRISMNTKQELSYAVEDTNNRRLSAESELRVIEAVWSKWHEKGQSDE